MDTQPGFIDSDAGISSVGEGITIFWPVFGCLSRHVRAGPRRACVIVRSGSEVRLAVPVHKVLAARLCIRPAYVSGQGEDGRLLPTGNQGCIAGTTTMRFKMWVVVAGQKQAGIQRSSALHLGEERGERGALLNWTPR